MPSYEVWDVVKVPFPISTAGAAAPSGACGAVPDALGAPDLLWVLMVTSAANRGWPGDVMVSDLPAAGLTAASVVRSAKIATIEMRDVERIGALSLKDRTLIVEALRKNLRVVLIK